MGLRALDQAVEAVFIAAPDGAIVYANQAARSQWGLTSVTFSLEMLLANVAPRVNWQAVVENVPQHQLVETGLGDFWLSTEPYRESDANFLKITIQSAEGAVTAEEASPSRQSQLLLEASRAIGATFEQSQVIQVLVSYARELGGAAGAIFYQYDQVNNLLAEAYGLSQDGSEIESAAIIKQQQLEPLEDALFDFMPVVLTGTTAGAWPTPAEFGAGPFQILIMALTLHEEPYGMLALFQQAEVEPFSAVLQTSLEILLSHTGLAIENARLFTDTYQRESFSNALGRVSLATSATLDLESVLNLICQESITTFQVDGIYIWQRDEDELVGLAAIGYGTEDFLASRIALEDAQAFSAIVSRTGEATFINQFEKHPNLALALPQHDPILSVLGVPLRREEETIGVLVLTDTRTADKFNQRDVSRALQFGSQAAIAIQNAHLVHELRGLNEDLDSRVAQRTIDLERERDRVQFLLRITSELAASLDEDRVLNRALELVNEIVNASESMILLLDPETDMFHYRAVLGGHMQLPAGGLSTGRYRHEGLAGWLLNSREALIANDIHEDERWQEIAGEIEPEYHSVLGAPLFSGDDAIGVLLFFHEAAGAFSQQQMQLVRAVAVQVANAIGNAQLYFFIQDQAEQIGSLLREEQKEAAKNEAILESIADGLLVADDEGRVILANAALGQMLSLQDEDLIGRPINEMLGIY
ncbi:MAG: GAF domain-containing protein, partial [Anaerolineales bacterium]|nr:GAF domain-containing protein [Anaerolineales bacterium]